MWYSRGGYFVSQATSSAHPAACCFPRLAKIAISVMGVIPWQWCNWAGKMAAQRPTLQR